MCIKVRTVLKKMMMKDDEKQETLTSQYLSARSLQMHVCKECGSVFFEEVHDKPAVPSKTEGGLSLFAKIIAVLLCAALLLACWGLFSLRQETDNLHRQLQESHAALVQKNNELTALKIDFEKARAQNVFFDNHIALVLEGKEVYHTFSCASYQNSQLPYHIYTVEEALKNGLAPCKNCHR